MAGCAWLARNTLSRGGATDHGRKGEETVKQIFNEIAREGTMNPDKIIQEIITACKYLVNEIKPGVLGTWGDDKWTKSVLTKLCQLGLRFGYQTFARSDVVDAEYRSNDWGEWLWDCVWKKMNSNGFLQSLPMVAESEWSDMGEIKKDFRKLLTARAMVRVMFYDIGRNNLDQKKVTEYLREMVGAFNGDKGDTYLLIAWNKNNDQTEWWFEFSKIISQGPGQRPILEGL